MKKSFFYLLLSVLATACYQPKLLLLDRTAFQANIDGGETDLYTLHSGAITMQVTNFGGRIVALWTPDKNGHYEDIVLGHANIREYIEQNGERFLGCVVGRYANRIAGGKFSLDGQDYQLPINNNGQTLHGGPKGLDMQRWEVIDVNDREIQMAYNSPHGDAGFPGELRIRMTYTLTPDNELKIHYQAESDRPTVINLSHHGFFNLKGEAGGSINDHMLTIKASAITPVDSVLIPTGELMPVEGSPFDFRQEKAIGQDLNQEHPQLKHGLGYDHNWVLDRKSQHEVEWAASLYEAQSGRLMEIWTDQPGLQFYGGNFMDGSGKGKYGGKHNYRESLALETQHFPDSPNQAHFPSTVLRPGEVYTHTCIYKFTVRR